MKLKCEEPNYCATVVRIHNLLDLEGLDNLVGYPVFGFQALMSKDHLVGELGVVFTAETQLDPEFCKENNLYRKGEFNKDPEQTGYLDLKGRVKALKLRGHVSSALFMPLSSLSYLGVNPEDFKEGDTFTHINGKEVCKKYVIIHPTEGRGNKVKGKTKKFSRVDALNFPEHFDTDNYWRNIHKLKDDDWIIVTQKIHGTSARFAHTLVKKKLNWRERFAKYVLKIPVQEMEYDTLAGSRRVVKDIKGQDNFENFYDTDLWNHHLEKIQHLIPPNFLIFGEIVGWANPGKAIQKNYSYKIANGDSKFYVYRIATINHMGYTVDLAWNQVKEFCFHNGLVHVPEIWQGYHKDFDEAQYMNKKFVDDLGLFQCLPLEKKAPCDEGVCVRVDGVKPYVLKAKSPEFLTHETKMLDQDVVDIESEESLEEV